VGFQDYGALATEVLQQEPAMAGVARPRIATAPAVTPDGVVFTVEAPEAAHVQLAGDFNDWSPDGNEMQPEGKVWRKTVKLPPGRYRYRYVIDGQWRSDPRNTTVEPSPFGGNDSVLTLDTSEPAESPAAATEADGTA
jgi:1,4-alpha-glucan branching enzyme